MKGMGAHLDARRFEGVFRGEQQDAVIFTACERGVWGSALLGGQMSGSAGGTGRTHYDEVPCAPRQPSSDRNGGAAHR